MPERPLCLSVLLALSVLVGCSGNRVAKGCHAVVLDRLDQIGVDLAEVKKISYARQTEGGDGSDRTIGWDAWVRFHSCQGALILFETLVEGRDRPFVFGSSGFLYRSNKLMYDRETHSLWNQFLGRPVVGPLTGSGLELKIRPVAITSWKDWRRRHPDTKVLSLDTGYTRDYGPGRAYAAYFDSPDLMFPARLPDTRLRPKDYVFALRFGKHEKAWPLTAFEGGKVINDTVGALRVVLIGDAATRTVRAYRAGGRAFSAVAAGLDEVEAEGRRWRVTEDALRGPGGDRLERLPGHVAYYFAWSGFKSDAPLYDD